jgi:3-hydroxy-9,10-secoandrosta-1,3,5(10)-triene-9,17-dione monooxygenase reductase component
MLSSGQEDVSRLFATKKSQEEKFAEIGHHLAQGVPVIDDCLAYLVCGLDSELRRGDHVIAIGQVLESGVDEDASPLLFYRAEYLRLPENDRVR